jgi:nucleotide-binding universal stress UspA family protein
MFRSIVVASDGSEGAGRAVSAAIDLAKTHGAELHMISVEELPQFPASVDEVIEEKSAANHFFDGVISRAKVQAQAQGVPLKTHLLTGHAVTVIVDFVGRERADLLVIGYMGHSAIYNRVIGSTTDRLVELAPSAVLVVK